MCKLNGNKIRQFRVASGMSQKELAKKMGVTTCAVQNYEAGRSGASKVKLKALCDALNVSEDDVKENINYSFLSGQSKIVDSLRKRKDFKGKYTPEETEAWIEEHRTETKDKIASTLKNTVKNATGFGNKKYCLVYPEYIHCPDWQRTTDMTRAMEIAENYDENKFDPIKIYVKNGKAYCADGMHRVIAAIIRNLNLPDDEKIMILVEILDCTERDARETFLYQEAGRKHMSIDDMYRAAIDNEDPIYLEFRKTFAEDFKIQISADKEKIENPVGEEISVTRGLLRMSHGKNETLREILDTMINLKWTGSIKRVFLQRNFSALMRLFAIHGKDTVYTALKDQGCDKAEYYEKHIYNKTTVAEVFDELSSVVNKYLYEQMNNVGTQIGQQPETEVQQTNETTVRKFA